MEEDKNNQALGFGSNEADLKNLFSQVTAGDSTPLKMRWIIEAVGRHVSADRCYVYFLRDTANNIWDNVYEWCAEGIPSIIAKKQGEDMSAFPDMCEAITSGQIWSFTNVDRIHPASCAILKPQGVKAMIIAPFAEQNGKVIGCVGFDFFKTHPDPIPASTVKALVEAVNMITASLQFRRKQEQDRMRENVIIDIGIGVWSFELDEGMPPRMYGNAAMDDLLGCDGSSLTPEQYYLAWYEHIHPAHREIVDKAVAQLVEGHLAEAQYPFLHPVRGQMWVRCGGRRDWSYKKGIRIIGRHQDITDLIHLQKDNDAELTAVQKLADIEKVRADRERDVNTALVMVSEGTDVTAILNKIMALWCRSLNAQWCVLGRFVKEGYEVTQTYSVFGGEELFQSGQVLEYIDEVSGEKDDRFEKNFISVVDFQRTEAAARLAKMSTAPKVLRSIASCHSRIVRFQNRRWGSIVLLFQDRHEFDENELRFIALFAHGIELVLLRREYEKRLSTERTEK